MPKHFHHDHYSCDSSSSDELYTNIRRPRHARHVSHTRHGSIVSSHHHHHVHEPAFAGQPNHGALPAFAAVAAAAAPPPPPPAWVQQSAWPAQQAFVQQPAFAPQQPFNLAVPVLVEGRKRAVSTNGLPQPIILGSSHSGSRSRSRERIRPRSRSRGRRYHDDDGIFIEDVMERRGRIRVSRSPSPRYAPSDPSYLMNMEKLKAFEEGEAAEQARKKFKAEQEIKRAKEQLEKAEADAKQKALEKKAIEDWQRAQAAKEAREKKEKEELDKKVEEEVRKKLCDYDLETDVHRRGEDEDRRYANEMRIARLRPTYIRVSREHVLPETLDAFDLPWEYDKNNSNSLLIKEYISGELQDDLFAHTRKLKSRKLLEAPVPKQTILKVTGKGRDKMYVVRKKEASPMRFVLR